MVTYICLSLCAVHSKLACDFVPEYEVSNVDKERVDTSDCGNVFVECYMSHYC